MSEMSAGIADHGEAAAQATIRPRSPRRLGRKIGILPMAIFGCTLLLGSVAVHAAGDGSDDGPNTRAALHSLLPGPAPAAQNESNAKPAQQPALHDSVHAFYAARNFRPAWTGNDDALARAALVKSTLEHAADQGLRPADYLQYLSQWKAQPKPGRDAAAYDIAMTTALFHYAKDVRLGRVAPKDVYRDVSLPASTFDAAQALADALRHDRLDEFLADLPPVHPGYKYLAQALAQYRAIAAAGGWPTIPGKKAIAVDGTDKREAVLAKRLAFEDPDLASNPSPTDADIRDAVLRYEGRNGLKVDPKVEPDMIAALNIRASYRVQEIAANMERWRWLPRYLEPRYVEVDVPDQSLKYVDNGEVLLRSLVVIGTKATPTPILRTEVKAVVVNPPWDIPDDLAARKILPKLRRNPNYLSKRNMMLAGAPTTNIKINWRHVTAANLPYQIQQAPGPDNALGTMMLDMPNPFDVYLHDTPSKKLFTLDVREKSNGCVRVQEIAKLASYALSGSEDENSDELAKAVASGQTNHFALSDPLAIYMVYWTAIAGPNGIAGFRPDRYNRDPKLIAKLGSAPQQQT